MAFRKYLLLSLLACCCSWSLAAAPPKSLSVEEFDRLHQMIKRQPGEARFHDVPWLLSVWEARKQAAAEGKPILIWSGSGGPPLAVC
jgi:hypothetical protein